MDIILPALILSVMGVVFGVALAFASKVFAIKADERVALVREALPGANCAACGYNGCDAFAEAVVKGEAKANLCAVGGQPVADRIGALMGIDAGNVELKTARVKCAGTDDVCGDKLEYRGIETCAAASMAQEGPAACGYGCVGLGDCVRACKFNAIYIYHGVADVIAARCTACGMCAAACPKKLIELVPVKAHHMVRCVNKDRGAITSKSCKAGCIGCKRCTTVCSVGAVTVSDNLASIDTAKCRQCGECIKVCPRKCINYYDCVLRGDEAV